MIFCDTITHWILGSSCYIFAVGLGAESHDNIWIPTKGRLQVATKNETVDTPQDPPPETGQLNPSDLEAVVGGNDPVPPSDVAQTGGYSGPVPAGSPAPPTIPAYPPPTSED